MSIVHWKVPPGRHYYDLAREGQNDLSGSNYATHIPSLQGRGLGAGRTFSTDIMSLMG
ncbi:MAG: hypothetical protein LBS03_10490 [Bacteroidales bacterium]|nr:hypothetical protein [Bacteroidales bacterium]